MAKGFWVLKMNLQLKKTRPNACQRSLLLTSCSLPPTQFNLSGQSDVINKVEKPRTSYKPGQSEWTSAHFTSFLIILSPTTSLTGFRIHLYMSEGGGGQTVADRGGE